MKHLPEGLKDRFKLLEKRISNLEDRSIEMFRSNKQKEKNTNNRILENCSASTSTPTCAFWESQKGRQKKEKTSICRNNGQKPPKFDEKKITPHTKKKNSTNSMQDKFKEIHTWTVK